MKVTDQECVDYARECERLAEMAKDQEIRKYLLDLAREWMALAMREDRMSESKTVRTH